MGELATEVHSFEARGLKRKKHGEPDKMRMANEVQGVLLCLLQVMRYYQVESEVITSLEQSYQRAVADIQLMLALWRKSLASSTTT